MGAETVKVPASDPCPQGKPICRQIGDGCGLQHAQHGLLRPCPDGVGGAEGLPAAGGSGDEAEVETDGTVYGFDYLAERCLAAGGKKLKAS